MTLKLFVICSEICLLVALYALDSERVPAMVAGSQLSELPQKLSDTTSLPY